MARVAIVKGATGDDPMIAAIFDWVTQMEGAVPNHFYVEMNFPEHFKAKLSATRVLWEMGELSLEEIQHVGILVSRDNGCAYCTAAFCTILNHGLGAPESGVKTLVSQGVEAVTDPRLKAILTFALKINKYPETTTDADMDVLRAQGLTDKGIVQLVHLVSDFASYNRLNLVLQTDYDYRDLWRAAAQLEPSESS